MRQEIYHQIERTLSSAPMRSLVLQRKCACGGIPGPTGECEACRKKRQTVELQRAANHAAVVPSVPPIVHDVLRSPGQPLDAATRAFMEPRFGHDFSGVRVHADARAADSAEAVSASAYTAGHNVVFAAGLYAPQSATGQRLLAHELAHVVQQGARPSGSIEIGRSDDPLEAEADRAASNIVDAGRADGALKPEVVHHSSAQAIQRVPAAPSYKSATGVINMSKLRFSPIPDFKAGDLRAPITLKPTLVDPALVHLSWELYDPSDTLIGGYSTLPGHAGSMTSSFELRPDMFKAGKATSGRYTMRLVGRNANHEPIVYFDRLFFVLGSDVTTGAANSNGFGNLTFTDYSKTDGDFAAGTDYLVNIKMSFLPKVDAVTCDEIGFLQVLESSDPQGKSNHIFAGTKKDARKTALNYSVDRAESGPSPFYGTYKKPRGNKIEPSGTTYIPGKGGHTPIAAKLEDRPSWSQPTVDRFETCVTCRTGVNSGQVYGCITWGFSVDAAGKVTLMPRNYTSAPSDTLKASLDKWNTWRAAEAKPSDYEAAPPLK